MTEGKIRDAEYAARRFLEASKAAKERLLEDHTLSLSGCKETATLRRASMELTRALTELRRPR